MNTWDRFTRTINREKTDHVPVALIGTSRFFASISGFSLASVLHRPDILLEAQKKTFALFPEVTFIPGAWPDYGVSILSAYGCRIFWTENGMPQIKGEIIQTFDDLKALKIPNPNTDGMMPIYLNTLRLFMDEKGIFADNLHFVWSFGPGEISSYLYGLTQLLLAFVDDQVFSHHLLDKVTEGIITWLNAQLEINPAAEGILLTDDISGMVSRTHYEKYIYPCHVKIREAFPDLIIVFHNDAKSNHILESIAKTEFDVFNFGKTTSIEKCKDEISDQISLMGNVDPLDLMINGTEEEVFNEAARCLSYFSEEPGYILSVGGGLNQNIPECNIRALIKASWEQ